ncbi:hypothetical protein [Brucella sp. 10RB9213]|uniref:hypothetical protein n=1 Tax=Brucella sp. 10RB9213 TaxID=1844039 RepID=UPI00316AD0BB
MMSSGMAGIPWHIGAPSLKGAARNKDPRAACRTFVRAAALTICFYAFRPLDGSAPKNEDPAENHRR